MPTRSPKDMSTHDPEGSVPEVPPDAPAIPSFASLRARRRDSPVDLLLPEPGTRASGATDRPAPRPSRPPDYADLVRLGVHVARALAALPVRVTLWSVREPARLLRRLGRPRGPVAG